MIRDYIAATVIAAFGLVAIVAACSLAVLTYRALLRRWMVFLIRLELHEAAEREQRRRTTAEFTRWRSLQETRRRAGR